MEFTIVEFEVLEAAVMAGTVYKFNTVTCIQSFLVNKRVQNQSIMTLNEIHGSISS